MTTISKQAEDYLWELIEARRSSNEDTLEYLAEDNMGMPEGEAGELRDRLSRELLLLDELETLITE